jgi:peptide/nickel transport system permease protein
MVDDLLERVRSSGVLNFYLVKRLLYSIGLLWAVMTLLFGFVHLLPGSAATMILGQSATEQSIQQVEQQLGLNRPLYFQYFDWLTGVLVSDWGTSLVADQPVTEMVWPRLIRSLQLALISTIIVIVSAVPLGVIAAADRGSVLDRVISNTSYLGVSLPEFVSGTLLVLFLAGPPLELFPTGGYAPLREGVFAWLSYLILPALTLTLILFAHVMRQTRSAMIDSLNSEYIRTARLKGLDEKTVLFKHALRNGLLPTITVIAINFGWMMGSLVVVEEVFTYPGLGRLIINAIETRDLPLIQIGILIPTASYIFANLLSDLLYSFLDPTIDFGGQ